MGLVRLALVLGLAAVAACQKPPVIAPPKGDVVPTVAGGTGATYPTLQAARTAFTRQNGTITATLEDASWIRLEGDPDGAEARHRAYFEYGYTTFQVVLQVKEFVQPTAETFVLEDSLGARHVGKPISFSGGMIMDNDRWTYRFDLSFPHAMTREVQWLRLTRAADGSVLEWAFPAGR
jgi:hypothetical protein